MLETTRLSETKRALLEKYVRGKSVRGRGQEGTIPQRPSGTCAPLSFGQQQMWLLDQLIQDTPVYNESVTLRLPGRIHVPALEQSLNAFIERHEVWRTSFPVVDDQPVQMVHPELRLTLSVVDLRSLPEAAREPEAIRQATLQARPFFDLTQLPLLRAVLIRLADEDYRLYLTLHHIIFDGTIYTIFLPELYAHYEAFSQGKPSSLPPLPIQYADFAVWQRERLRQGELDDQLNYWKQQLKDAPAVLALPTDRPRPSVQTYHGKRLGFSLSRELTDEIKAFSREHGVTLYMTLVAAFNILLYRYTGQEDVLIGTTTGGHSHKDVQKLIGLFLNTLVLRTDLSGKPSCLELLKRVRDVVLDANAHPDVPFPFLIKELQPERNIAWNPLIQVIISLEPPLPVLSSGWTITQSDVEIHTAKFDLYLELDDRPDGFDAWLEYNTDLFDETTALRMVEHWRTLLAAMIAHPTMSIADLPLLTDVEYQQALRGETVEQQLAYWRKQLADVPTLLPLPTDYSRLARSSYNSDVHCLRLSPVLSEALKELSDQEGVTLYVFLLAALFVLLYRYTRQEDMVVGTVMADQEATETASQTNLLVLRTDLGGNPSFRQYLKQVHNVFLEAQTHADVPFESLLDLLNVEQNLKYHPLVQVVFALVDPQQQSVGQPVGTRSFSLCERESASAPVDLALEMINTPEELCGKVTYSTDLFEQATIARMVQHWQILLEAIVHDLSQPIALLPLLPKDEQRLLLDVWNETRTASVYRHCLHTLFEEQVLRSPDAVALLCEEHMLTYEELNQRANQLAYYLQQHGVGPEVRVCICMERSLSLLIGVLGILKAGGAYVPLDPQYPIERLAYMLQDAASALLLTHSAVSSTLATVVPSSMFVVTLDQDADSWRDELLDNPTSTVTAEHLAYLIYTSGSTGQPKGTMITHQSACNNMQWRKKSYPLSSLDCVLQKTSLSFDPSVWELFWPLASGARLLLAKPGGEKDIPYLLATIRTYAVSVLNSAPSTLRILLEENEWRFCESTRMVMCGGEALPVEVLKRFFACSPADTLLSNMYGPTEVTIDATYVKCERDEQLEITSVVPIGRPVPNAQIFLLDTYGVPVPIGVPGEVYIGGIGLARGYHQRPELTAERFVPHAFSKEPGLRLYRTGDLARYRADGMLEFLGRIDHQVKVRGFRIELGEIESVLVQHQAIKDAIVMPREDAAGNTRLVAYIVPERPDQFSSLSEDAEWKVLSSQEAGLTFEELRMYLRDRVPDYMVPATILFLDAFPLTSNHKIDRRALQKLEASVVLEHYKQLTLPRTPVEELIANIWAQLFQVERVDIHDNFFTLGGHSLLAAQLLAQIRRSLHVEVPLHVLFESPTIAELAQVVAQRLAVGNITQPVVPQALDREVYQQSVQLPVGEEYIPGTLFFPASFGQQRLWLVDQLEGSNPAYHIPLALRLHMSLDLAIFEQSLQAVITRHEILRTRFLSSNDTLWQVVEPAITTPLPMIDLTGSVSREQEAQQVLAQEARRPFDLSHGPLLRVLLVKLNHEEMIILFTLHHIIFDGWSVGLFVDELLSLYEAYTQQQPSALPALAVQYADVAVWQQQMIQEAVLKRQLAYWKKQLAGAPGLSTFPADRPRPAQPSHRGSLAIVRLPEDLSESLKGLSRQEGVTLYMLLVAAFQTLLARYTQQDDVAIGTVMNGRQSAETEALIGFFVNTLVLRTDLSGTPTFRQVLQRVREVVIEAHAHQDVPFEYLVKELQPDRSLGQNPFFQVMLTLDLPLPAHASRSDVVEMEPINVGATQVDLLLEVAERPGGLVGRVEYDTDLFDRSTIERLMRHWEVLLRGIVAEPERAIAELPLLTEMEYEQQIVDWNATEAAYPRAQSLQQVLASQAQRSPDAIAVVCGEASLTYQALHQRAEAFAGYLQQVGVSRGELVGLSVDRSLEMLVGLLAILKVGGAYVPLDPGYPTERLAFMMEDARLRFVVTQQHVCEHLPLPASMEVVYLDEERAEVAVLNEVTVQPEDLAYVLYTSGSTGRPKGVQIPHRALVNFLWSMRQVPGMTEQDRLLAVTTLSFDIAGLELYLPLLVGGCVVIATQEITTNGVALAQTLEREQISVMQATPVTWRLLVAAGWTGMTGLKALCGGEALPPELAEQVCQRVDSLYNLYGPTETTIWSTVSQVQPGERPISIGRPIANTQVYVLDPQGQPVPLGVAGELYIGGDGLSHGYLHRAELTQERFVADPFRGQGRMYRTGDLVRYRADGTLEHLGRLDQQVKLRGHRIELGEIEAVLVQQEGVREAVVLVREDQPGEQRLVAYIIRTPEQQVSGEALREALAAALPGYMVPSALHFLEAWPLTPNGKIDRKALPAPELGSMEQGRTLALPRTPVEELVATIWAQMLQVQRVGIHDNFFTLGGHSLLGIQVLAQVRKSLQVELPLRALFEAPTVAELAQVITQAKGAGTAQLTQAPHALERQAYRLPRQLPDGIEVPVGASFFPASFTQQRLWFVEQLEGPSAAYNLPLALRFRMPLELGCFERSLQTIIARHESLRTSFLTVDGEPQQMVLPVVSLPLTIVDLSGAGEATVQQLLEQEVRRPFDLSQAPLLRMVLVRLGEEEAIFLCTMHHSISDGWSLGVFVHELLSLYEAYTQQQPSALPSLLVQYADVAVWQQQMLQGAALERQLIYWRKQLAGAPGICTLPADRPRSTQSSRRGRLAIARLSADQSEALKALSRQEGVTLYMLLVAAFQTLFYRYTQQDDIVLGTVTAGRTFPEMEPLIGFFTNTLVLRTSLAGNPTFQQVLQRVREVVIEAHAHQDVPFEHLVKELQPDRSLGQNPFFQMMLTLDPPFPSLLSRPEVAKMDPIDIQAAKFDLFLEFADQLEGLVGYIEYSTDLFDARTIERLIAHWNVLLQGIVASPMSKLSELPLLTTEEQQQLLVEWNATQVSYPQNVTVSSLFEEQVERTPDAIAVIYEDACLTYRELNCRANQMAHYLGRQGIHPQERVGLCLERNIDMLIGLLGIVKAGCVYVPLDPSYPLDRLAFMIDDAQLRGLVTTQQLFQQPPTLEGIMIYLDVVRPKIEQEREINPGIVTPDTELLYVIYTSGSTGRPKGVQGTQQAALNRFFWMWTTYPFEDEEICCQKTALSFVDSIWEIFGPLLRGIRTVIIPDMVVKEPSRLVDLFVEQQVSRIVLVPSLLQIILETQPGLLQRLPHLLYWICSGEALPLPLVQRFRESLPGRLLLNLYGSSEVAADATYFEVNKLPTSTNVPIGRPIANMHIYLLDRALQLLPVGVPGEIYVGGAGLARGYFNRPELTAERFVPNSFAPDAGALLYKTGDLARYLPDGTLEYLGRNDYQVKLRGFRIDLGEIETLLRQDALIRDAVVMVREDGAGEKQLIAYIVPAAEQLALVDMVRQSLQRQLPSYMVPATFIPLESLPLTPNGKIDRLALATLASTALPETKQEEQIQKAPRSLEHYLLLQLWEELLDVRPIGIGDNFFHIGGHSLLAARLLARIEQTFGKKISLSTLFACPTIEELAEALQLQGGGNTQTPIRAVQAGGTNTPFFFLHGDWTGGPFYCFNLSRTFGTQQPFYALDPYKFNGPQIPTTLEEMAAAHLRMLRTIQPEGPYLLGGFCNGALVAYEAARQLAEAGESIDLLLLVTPVRIPASYKLVHRFVRTFGTLLRLKKEQQLHTFLRIRHLLRHIYRRLRPLNDARIQDFNKLIAIDARLNTMFPPDDALRNDYIGVFVWLAAPYKQRFYPENVSFIWAQEELANQVPWDKVAEQKEAHVMPGVHMACVTEHIELLASYMHASLKKALKKNL